LPNLKSSPTLLPKKGGQLNLKERYVYINVLRTQCRKANKKSKSKILDELVKNTNFNRDYGAFFFRTKTHLKNHRKRSKPP